MALTWSGGWIASTVGVSSAPPLAFSATRFLIAGMSTLPERDAFWLRRLVGV